VATTGDALKTAAAMPKKAVRMLHTPLVKSGISYKTRSLPAWVHERRFSQSPAGPFPYPIGPESHPPQVVADYPLCAASQRHVRVGLAHRADSRFRVDDLLVCACGRLGAPEYDSDPEANDQEWRVPRSRGADHVTSQGALDLPAFHQASRDLSCGY